VKKGLLIAFEGIDGTGKSTQLELLANYLRARGYDVVTTREPTDGPYGRKIRALYTERDQHSLEEELELFVEDRRQHVRELIKPALEQGKIVLTDRYYFSTAAYQGAAGADPKAIFEANSFAPEPDLVVLLTMEPEQSVARIQELRGESLNDFEQVDQLRRVAAFFVSFDHPRITRIDADRPLDEVQQEIRNRVDTLLEQS
jgi:dTMP kinase